MASENDHNPGSHKVEIADLEWILESQAQETGYVLGLFDRCRNGIHDTVRPNSGWRLEATYVCALKIASLLIQAVAQVRQYTAWVMMINPVGHTIASWSNGRVVSWLASPTDDIDSLLPDHVCIAEIYVAMPGATYVRFVSLHLAF